MKYYWHGHHDILCEFFDNIKGRIEFIKNNKPKNEIGIRLKLLKEVKGQLPQAWLNADKAKRDADNAKFNAWRDKDVVGKMWEDVNMVWEDANMVWEDANMAWKNEIEALHKIECPNCLWDGKTIVFP